MFPISEYIQSEVDYRSEHLRRLYPTHPRRHRLRDWLRKST